jgi:hypothetical protein
MAGCPVADRLNEQEHDPAVTAAETFCKPSDINWLPVTIEHQAAAAANKFRYKADECLPSEASGRRRAVTLV